VRYNFYGTKSHAKKQRNAVTGAFSVSAKIKMNNVAHPFILLCPRA
jgi:hypothetical protein